MDHLLKLENISLTYHTIAQQTKAVDKLNFNVDKGEFIAIIGPSGCGKTSILSMIAGILKPTEGKIYISGKQLLGPTKDIGYMLQKDELFEWLTIYKNVLLPLKINKTLSDKTKEYVDELLKKYGLYEFKNYYPHELSGGMRQRAALIRTLSFSPTLLLLDEPFSALDYQTRLAVCDDVYAIIKKEKKTAILVTHDISEAISVADRVIVLSERPTKIYNMHVMNFDKALTPLKRREKKFFGEYFDLLWKELNR